MSRPAMEVPGPSSHNVVFRGSAAPPPPPRVTTTMTPPEASDVWAGAIARVQQQVVYNTSLLESHRRQMYDMDQAIGRLHADFTHAASVINDFRGELRQLRHRPTPGEPSFKHDPGDLDVIANQIASITSKANEVEGLKMQLELMKNRIKRMEDHGPSPGSRPESSTTPREQHHPPAHPLQSLPPMRTASMASRDDRPPLQHPPPGLLSQGPSPRPYSTDAPSMQPAQPSFRPSEPSLPPPSSFSGWRPAEPSHGVPPPPGGMFASVSARSHISESSGWAAVNQPSKRPFEDARHSPYGSPHMAAGSPKRPKLAPIMPRGSHSDENVPLRQPVAPDDRVRAHSRAPSDGGPAYRFIPSSQQADPQDNWRSEHDHIPIHHLPGRGGRGRGRGGRGRGRGREGPPPPHHHQHRHHEEHITPRPEEVNWRGGPVGPNGHYIPMHPPHSPPGRGQSDREHPPPVPLGEFPATPFQATLDPFQQDGGSSSKKSRTKPIRNAEGILIRKDGRPDMRSVSSANNLRKVHAKKEAERAETEGRTPPSPSGDNSESQDDDHHGRARSDGTPTSTTEGQDGRHHGQGDTRQQDSQGRTRELMSKIFPPGYDGSGTVGERSFSQLSPRPSSADVRMKMENMDVDERRQEPRSWSVDMQGTSTAAEKAGQPEHERPADAKMTTVVEGTEA